MLIWNNFVSLARPDQNVSNDANKANMFENFPEEVIINIFAYLATSAYVDSDYNDYHYVGLAGVRKSFEH